MLPAVLCPAGPTMMRSQSLLDLDPQAGEMLTRVEDAIRAATRGGVNQLWDGEGQPLRRNISRKEEEKKNIYNLLNRCS